MKIVIEKNQQVVDGNLVSGDKGPWGLTFNDRTYYLSDRDIEKLHYELGKIIERFISNKL